MQWLAVLSALATGAASAASFQPGDEVEAAPRELGNTWYRCSVARVIDEERLVVACGADRTEYEVPKAWVRVPPPSASGACVLGARVRDQQGRSGVVIESRESMCTFRTDDGMERYALPKAVTSDQGSARGSPGPRKPPAPAAPPSGAGTAIRTGTYRCSMPGAGTLNLTIESATRYATFYSGQAPRAGECAFSGGQLVFSSGPLAGNHGGVIRDGKIGLTSKAGTRSYHAVCDLQK